MKQIKVKYTKVVASYDEQIERLRTRGVKIYDEIKAKEYLSDIGYYRLGFYIFPKFLYRIIWNKLKGGILFQ